MNRLQAIVKIKKCLRLSTSTNELETVKALKQAQILMQQFDVIDIDMQLSKIKESGLKVPASMPRWRHTLFEVCLLVFGVYGYIRKEISASSGEKIVQFRFYGISPKPELATYAYKVILRQLHCARRKYMEEELSQVRLTKNKTYRADQFCEGWVLAVKSMVKKFAIREPEQQQLEAYMHSEIILE